VSHPASLNRRRIGLPILVAAVGFASLGGCAVLSQGQNAEGVRMYDQAYYEGALRQFQKAVDSNPRNSDAYYNLGATYHQLAKLHHRDADYSQAESYYHHCLDENPNHEECYRSLAVLLVERGHGDQAHQLLSSWSQRSPNMPGPRIELARLSEEQGDRNGAQQELIEALSIDPHNARALTALGRLREQSGDTAQALANYQRSLQVNRYQPEVAARVASLQGATTPIVTPPNGTRTVNINNTAPGATQPSLLR
jgi:tetratricopeptide (TPR) repeat protein